MYVAVDIGGTKTLVAVFDEAGRIVAQETRPTNTEYDAFREELCEQIEKLADLEKTATIAVGAPGLMDYETDTVRRFGNLGWQNVELKHELMARFHVPVVIDNDANMGAVGEANLGAGQNYRVMLYVTLSTGIGTGITTDGSIDPALAKSEGGQMHFRHEDQLVRWEEFASGKAFMERFGKLGKEDDNPAHWQQWAEDVSLGFGSLIAIIQPDAIVIGGSMGQFLEKYHHPLLEALQKTRSWDIPIPPILQAHDAQNAVIYGCYVAGKKHAKAD